MNILDLGRITLGVALLVTVFDSQAGVVGMDQACLDEEVPCVIIKLSDFQAARSIIEAQEKLIKHLQSKKRSELEKEYNRIEKKMEDTKRKM